ncbi:unnamed protein product [Effrenium voratum]|uniref:Uncharacterized protein n=1 Tax=Effrenium voratum TaxID=2562239 RepID=A0AA36I496_9DINO|nr:unnamed protein product [Effrenium voratum]CAJ1429700.1 unnamed protein product [Effrenium voratum]
MCRQLYNLVLLKCLQYGDSARALDFWQETHTGIASCNAVLATCEPEMDWPEWVEACGELGPASWLQAVIRSASRATLALARGKTVGHGPGWQQDALGQVALTMDVLSWHGLAASISQVTNLFAENVLEFVLEAIIAETDETILYKSSTGRTSTRLREPILKGCQLQNVMLSSSFTKEALQKLQLAADESWLPAARLQARRGLPAQDQGDGLDPAGMLRARWAMWTSPDGQGQSRGLFVLGGDAGCKEWLAPHALENAMMRAKGHEQLLSELVQEVGIKSGQVRMYMSYIPCLACLAQLYQLRSTGLKLQIGFDTWRETRHWVG